MSIQQQIDKLEYQYGQDHPDVQKARQKFNALSQSEMNGDSLGVLIHKDTSEIKHEVQELKSEFKKIREVLEIRGECSIDYSFISEESTKKGLIKDNISMENIRLDSTIKDDNIRFRKYCLTGFYQIESLLNYYFRHKYEGDVQGLHAFLIKHNTKRYADQAKREELSNKDLRTIDIADKITAFGFAKFSGLNNFTGFIMNNMRKVRNQESHRNTSSDYEDKQLQRFLDYKNYDEVMYAIVDVTNIIKKELL